MKALYFIFVIFILSSCASVYIPSFNETPIFSETKSKIISSSLTTNSIQVYGAYALAPNFFVSGTFQASYNTLFPTSNYDNDIGDSEITFISLPLPYKHWYASPKFGYFTTLNNCIIGVHGGIGVGYGKDKGINESQKKNHAIYYKPNLLFDISYKTRNVIYGGGIEQNILFFNQHFFTKSNYQTEYKEYETYIYRTYCIQSFSFVKSNFPTWNIGGIFGAQFIVPKTDIDYTRLHMSININYSF
ncbi:MAG TPA: hypothetical protein PLS12_04995 [Bacteroidales bacterium]|nr:hypothetical protein [Bacteroidales bacterium]